MAGFISRDSNDKIVSISYSRQSDTDIEVNTAFVDSIFNQEDVIENYFIKDNKLVSRIFKISNSTDTLIPLEYQDEYDLTIASVIVLPVFKKKLVVLAFPPQYIDQYLEHSFRLQIDETIININVNEFKNDFLVVNCEVDEQSVFKISSNINHVVLTHQIKNIIITKNDELIGRMESDSVNSNVINIVKKSGKLKLPAHLHNQIAYYVNIENRNEIIDIVRTSNEIDYIPNTVIIIGRYEINAY